MRMLYVLCVDCIVSQYTTNIDQFVNLIFRLYNLSLRHGLYKQKMMRNKENIIHFFNNFSCVENQLNHKLCALPPAIMKKLFFKTDYIGLNITAFINCIDLWCFIHQYVRIHCNIYII